LLFDRSFLPIVERLRPQLKTIEHFILFDSAAEGDYLGFREWVGAEDGHYSWVDLNESEPCGLCYTSGTTGNPKGVLYLHRSNVLHALAEMQPDVFDLSARAVALPVVPMFHANAWGLPYAAAAAGAKLVFSCTNDASVLWKLIREEKVTHSAGVPTVWLSMFADMDANGGDYARLRHVVIGGSAAPRAMIERLMKAGITVAHAWGMTETSPIGTMGARPYNWDDMSFDEQVDMVTKQGRVPYGVELRVVDDNDELLPRDGKSSGRLQIRGHWIIQRYFDAEVDAADAEGWFDTGDVAMIYPDGVMQITDRAKDVIKSGGEWISSIELENAAMGAPGVAEAAAVGVPHPKWDERPVLLVIRKPGSAVTAEEINAHLVNHVAKWWLPDEVIFVDSLPHTATGKLLKRQLRDDYKSYKLKSL
jgi:fatty-acyl-CoA synthase